MRRWFVTFFGAVSALVLFSAVPAAGASSSANSWATRPHATAVHLKTATTLTFGVLFGGPFESHHFTISASGGNKLTVSTEDCCTQGDHWGVFVNDLKGGFTVGAADRNKGNCGTGSITAFTGSASIGSFSSPFSGTARAQVVYCSGVDIFGASMTVKFVYNGPTLVVTQDT